MLKRGRERGGTSVNLIAAHLIAADEQSAIVAKFHIILTTETNTLTVSYSYRYSYSYIV